MFDFVGKRYWFFLLSALVIVPGIIALATVHLKPGVDFKSGTSITLSFGDTISVSEDDLRGEMSSLGYTDSLVQSTGSSSFYITIPGTLSTEEEQTITKDMVSKFGYDFPADQQPEYLVVSRILTSETARNAAIAIAVEEGYQGVAVGSGGHGQE